jgi:hypothetical protein
LEPKSKAKINDMKMFECVSLYKEENRDFIKRVLHSILHIDFEKFCADCWEQLDKFNSNLKGKKYVYILGVNNQVGSSNTDYNIYKSNLWMFMLLSDKLKTKPIDILLNVKIAIQLYADSVEYLIVDDCSYLGTQIVEQVLYSYASEAMYKCPGLYSIRNDVYKKQCSNLSKHIILKFIYLYLI